MQKKEERCLWRSSCVSAAIYKLTLWSQNGLDGFYVTLFLPERLYTTWVQDRQGFHPLK